MSALGQPLQPRTPPTRPRCRHCGWTPRFRSTVRQSNPNGNAGRHYYVCFRCTHHRRNGQDHCAGWIAWDDRRGISSENPLCYCNAVSRQDRAVCRAACMGLGSGHV